MSETKRIINACLGLIMIGLLMPYNPVKEYIFRNGICIKVIYNDGSFSELINNKWIYHEKEDEKK